MIPASEPTPDPAAKYLLPALLALGAICAGSAFLAFKAPADVPHAARTAAQGVSLPALPPEAQIRAIESLGLKADETAALAQDVKRKRIAVVMLPLRALPNANGAVAASVTVATPFAAETVALTPQWRAAPVVMNRTSLVTLTLNGADAATMAANIEALDAFGPVALPRFDADSRALTIGVIAQ